MHDARALDRFEVRKLRVSRQKGIDQRPVRPTGAGMNCHSDWLVDDDHMIIVVYNIDVEILRHRSYFIQGVAWQVKFDAVTRINPCRRAYHDISVN